MNGSNFTPFLIRHRDDVGDVVFALRIVVVQLRQPAFHVCAIGDQNTGINFLDFTLRIGRIFVLNNARHLAVFTGDTAITGRIVQLNGQQTNAALRLRGTQASQRLHGDQRHVTVKHQDIFVVGEERGRLLHGVTGAQLFCLQHPVELVITQRLLQQIATVAVDQVYLARAHFIRSINDMLHHRFPCQGVQHFWKIGIHAGAFACGKNDHAHCIVQHTRPDCNLSEK